MAKQELTPILRQFHDLKQKHPDAVLLFRCGDFYETYEDDAKTVSKELGITLTKRTGSPKGEGYMAGFPYHALDTYLPKIIRAGHRVAICDMLEPPKKLVRRGSDELTTTATNISTDNYSKSQETMKLNLSNQSENQNVQNAQVMTPTTVVVFATPAQDIVDADFEEVKPEPVAEEKPKKKVTIKRKVTLKKKQPITGEAPQTQPVSEAKPSPSTGERGEGLPQVQFSTYKTKKGNLAPQIVGFSGEDDPRWKAHKDAGNKYVSASFRRDLSGNKVYVLLFGTKYMDVAKALAGAYNTNDRNAWKRAEDACMAIYEQAQRDGKAKWEEKKQQWAEKKAERQAAKTAEEQAKKCYTKEDVAAMLKNVLAGGDVPEDIKRLLAV